MAARWTVDQVLSLAPDQASVRAGRTAANSRTWSDLGTSGSLLWGKCQGSAKAPYQVVVDMAGQSPTTRCTCPSRKQPCKHGLGLLLMWARRGGSVADVPQAAPFAAEWAVQGSGPPGRRREEALEPAQRAPDAEAKARRAAEREATMDAGLEEFARWLCDLARDGLAGARQQPYSYWDTAAARLVDAQAPGLADRVRSAGSLVRAELDWPSALLAEVGRWWSAVQGWRRRAQLPEDLVADLRTYLGVARRKEEVESRGTLSGSWVIAGLRQGGDERVRSQRTWLWGPASGQWYLVLDFAVAGATLQAPGVVGARVEGSLALYPGASPKRALLVGERKVLGIAKHLPAAGTVAESLDWGAQAIAANPWLDRYPAALAEARVVPRPPVTDAVLADGNASPGWVVGVDGEALELGPGAPVWELLAVTGGHPAGIFGEVEAGAFFPATVEVNGELVAV